MRNRPPLPGLETNRTSLHQTQGGSYTTNAIESLNYQLRKIIKNRGHFPNDDAVIKLLWLAIRDIEDKRARQRAAEAGKPRTQRKAPGRLVEGATTHGWRAALGALTIAYPDRLAGRI